jgi:plasmid stabilization system protein ParE
MAARYDFHPEALREYSDATLFYLSEASPEVANRFVTAIESAIVAMTDAPERHRVVEEPDMRRCVVSRFPFLIYYRWDPRFSHLTIYAVMHSSREPGYWRKRAK